MTFEFTPALRTHITAKKIHGIIVEVASCDHTDLQVTELHVHFVTEKQAQGFVKRRNFIKRESDCCALYFPAYRLEYADRIQFDLKKIGPFAFVKCEGIAL